MQSTPCAHSLIPRHVSVKGSTLSKYIDQDNDKIEVRVCPLSLPESECLAFAYSRLM